MSLERAIEANTAAVQEQTAALIALHAAWDKLVTQGNKLLTAGGVPVAEAPKVEMHVEPLDEAPKAEKQAAKAKPVKTEETPAPVEETPDDAPDVVAETLKEDGERGIAVFYEEVRDLVLSMAKTHREEIKALNKANGIVRLSDLLDKADDFSTVNDLPTLEKIYMELGSLGEK